MKHIETDIHCGLASLWLGNEHKEGNNHKTHWTRIQEVQARQAPLKLNFVWTCSFLMNSPRLLLVLPLRRDRDRKMLLATKRQNSTVAKMNALQGSSPVRMTCLHQAKVLPSCGLRCATGYLPTASFASWRLFPNPSHRETSDLSGRCRCRYSPGQGRTVHLYKQELRPMWLCTFGASALPQRLSVSASKQRATCKSTQCNTAPTSLHTKAMSIVHNATFLV